MQEARVRSQGWEDPLEKEMATHSSILAWETPWTGESDGLQSTGSQLSDQTTTTMKVNFSVPEQEEEEGVGVEGQMENAKPGTVIARHYP